MYKFIINPKTNRKVSIFGVVGNNIIKQYLTIILGGATKEVTSKKNADFITTILTDSDNFKHININTFNNDIFQLKPIYIENPPPSPRNSTMPTPPPKFKRSLTEKKNYIKNFKKKEIKNKTFGKTSIDKIELNFIFTNDHRWYLLDTLPELYKHHKKVFDGFFPILQIEENEIKNKNIPGPHKKISIGGANNCLLILIINKEDHTNFTAFHIALSEEIPKTGMKKEFDNKFKQENNINIFIFSLQGFGSIFDDNQDFKSYLTFLIKYFKNPNFCFFGGCGVWSNYFNILYDANKSNIKIIIPEFIFKLEPTNTTVPILPIKIRSLYSSPTSNTSSPVPPPLLDLRSISSTSSESEHERSSESEHERSSESEHDCPWRKRQKRYKKK